MLYAKGVNVRAEPQPQGALVGLLPFCTIVHEIERQVGSPLLFRDGGGREADGCGAGR